MAMSTAGLTVLGDLGWYLLELVLYMRGMNQTA